MKKYFITYHIKGEHNKGVYLFMSHSNTLYGHGVKLFDTREKAQQMIDGFFQNYVYTIHEIEV